jgi:hypothetical protein
VATVTIFLLDADGAFLLDTDGAYLVVVLTVLTTGGARAGGGGVAGLARESGT